MDQHNIDRLCDIRDAAKALLDTLPRCWWCDQPATHGRSGMDDEGCDEHAKEWPRSQPHTRNVYSLGYEFPCAEAVRELTRLLSESSSE